MSASATVPTSEHLERYADVLVNFALGGGEGIRPGDVVQVRAPESAKPLYIEVCRSVWRAGGHVIGLYAPDNAAGANLSRDFFELASDEQLSFFPEGYRRALIDQCDHAVHILAQADPHALRGVDPARILRHSRALHPVSRWQAEKEDAGRFTWTACSYGTEAMAREAEMSREEYWEQIIAACFLDRSDPKAEWRAVSEQQRAHIAFLEGLPIERVHLEGPDVDLWITLGEHRRWMGGGGRNIPSFEIFTSPDWRGTEGWIRFSEPLYVYGSLITEIELEFHGGRVRRASAARNEQLLTEMLATENADRVGELSLTDARLSRITRFMADTLYDENVGGRHGNTHMALGRSLRIAYAGDATGLADGDWERLGFNDASIHTDLVSTTERTVTAVLRDGTQRLMYADGRFATPD